MSPSGLLLLVRQVFAGRQFVADLLLIAPILITLCMLVLYGQRIKGFDLVALIEPALLALRRSVVACLNDLALLCDGFIEFVGEVLIVCPLLRRNAGLRRFLKALNVFGTIVFEQFQLGFGVLFCRNKTPQIPGRLVSAGC